MSPYLIGAIWGAGGTLALSGLVCLLFALLAHRQPSQPVPLPIDRANPSSYVVFTRADDDPEVGCSCHGRTVNDGDLILHWPMPARLLCEDTFTEGER